ncbi:MAG: AbrB/MazE/SpoVT family DNA-binding domain-containing protein [Parcubacteria group bacterium]|nr:AbrB/MazE/SpoVT family DNA-binding domain-containing protein [Parcubacteria group bacterium]
MVQKVIKVGSSAAITISKQAIKDLGVSVGDSVRTTIDSKRRRLYMEPASAAISEETLDWTKRFIDRYRPALEALAKK